MNGPCGMLNELERRPTHPGEVLEQIGKDVLLPSFREEIYSEGHGDWQPLSPKTIAEKTYYGFPLNPEIRTYTLIESLFPGGPMNVLEVDEAKGTVTAGTAVPYAEVQQEGGTVY